jgi:hypothetical protein
MGPQRGALARDISAGGHMAPEHGRGIEREIGKRDWRVLSRVDMLQRHIEPTGTERDKLGDLSSR